MKKPKKPSGIVETQRAAGKRLGVTTKTLRAWRAEGAPGFEADGSINLGLLSPWIAARKDKQDGGIDLKSRKMLAECVKVEMANEQKAGRLIERAWMAERIQNMAGEINGLRVKSEAEHPLKFAQAEGDVPKCREIVRAIWDEILAGLQGLSKSFAGNKNQ